MDFDDHALLALARSITHRLASQRDRALAVHAHVRALPLAFPGQWGPATAGAVQRRRSGDAVDKATLFVALLRLCGVPARLLFAPADRDALRGLPCDVCVGPRPLVEACIDGAWICTDTFIFDEHYLRAAHGRLRKKQRDLGYGISASGAVRWDALRDASVLGAEHLAAIPPDADRYDDAADFARSMSAAERLSQRGEWVVRMLRGKALKRTLHALRAHKASRRVAARGRVSSVPAESG